MRARSPGGGIQTINGAKVIRILRVVDARFVATPPPPDSRPLIDPSIAAHHLPDPHEPKSDQAKCETDCVVDGVVVQRQEGGIEQGIVQEPHGKREREHVQCYVPPRTPRRRDCAPGKPGSAAPHEDAHEQHHAEGLLVCEKIGQRERHAQRLPPSRYAALTSSLSISSRPFPRSVIRPLTMTSAPCASLSAWNAFCSTRKTLSPSSRLSRWTVPNI